MSERISIEALQPGMVILQVTQQNGPVRIRKSGLVTSDAMVTGLREMGVQELEIDPEQTVEIQTEASFNQVPLNQVPSNEAPSQTQFLLQSNSASGVAGERGERGERETSTQQDSQLAEQFNRSLFLPTAQEIPDTWQIYARQFGTAAAVIILGFGLGFGAAVAPDLMSESGGKSGDTSNDGQSLVANVNTAQANGNQTSNNEPQPEAQSPSTESQEQPGSVSNNSAVSNNETGSALSNTQNNQGAAEPTTQLAQTAGSSQASQVSQTSPEPQIAEPKEPEMLVLGLQPEQEDAASTLREQDLSQNPEVSEALLKRFQRVMTEMEQNQQGDKFVPSEAPEVPEPEDVPRVDQMPQWILSSLPRLSFNAHMFATESADRWVKVNGKELGEGDWIDGQLRIKRIDPQHIILDFQGHEFSMRALSDW